MHDTPIALILASRVSRAEAHSALPHAPVVEHVDRIPVLQRTRAGAAIGLRRLADIVAPRRTVRRTPVTTGLCREAG